MQLRPDGDAQNKARITDLALNACDHVESEPGQLRDTRAWVAWLGDHLSPDMLHQQRPRVLAALLLHFEEGGRRGEEKRKREGEREKDMI